MAEGAGVPVGEGEGVGPTVGFGAAVFDGLLVGVTRAVGLGVLAGGEVGATVWEPARCARAGESVACCGRNCR